MPKTTNKRKDEDSTIFIGDKAFMNYVTAALLQFNSGSGEVFVKARGKHISRAVDVVEVLRNKFLNDVKLNGIEIGSEDVKSRDGREMKVSTIKINLKK